ncbi:MAG: sensor domain-containing diguanylate cyclase, partial [Thermomicrobiales bacterium]
MDTIYPVLLGTPPPPSGSGLPIPAPQAGPADLLTARHRTDEIHALLLCLGREVMAVTGRTRAEVLLLDAPGDRRGIAVWAGVATRERPVLQALVHLRPFLPAWSGGAALESITDLPAADPVTDVLRQLGRLLTLTLPIREGDQVVGRITVWSTSDTRAVSGPEINAAMAVVGQAGAALAELRRRHLADTHLVSQSALLSIARLAADRRFTGSTFAEVAAVTRQVIGADSAVISLLRRGGAEVVAVADSRAEGWDRPSDRGTRTPVTGDPAIARALADGGMVLLDDGTPWLGDAGREALRFSGTATRVYLALVHDGTVIGVLRLDFRSPRAVSDDECRVLADLAAQVATTLATIQRQAAFRRAATVDDLTGALRRQPVRAQLDAMLTGDAGRSRAVILARLDGVPGINADQGFLAGDRLLRVVANRLRCLAGLSATIGRWNGTEFLIILTGDDMDRAAALVEATAPGMADGTRALPGGVALRMGIAHVPSDGTTADELLEAALATMTPMPTPIVAPASVAPSVA